MVVVVSLRSRGRPLPGRPAGDLHAGHGPRPWSGGGATTAVEGDELPLLDDGLADGALLGVRVDVEPLVEAGPAEEVAAEGDHGVLRQVQADVALEAARVLAAAASAGAVGPRHRLAGAARHAAGIRSKSVRRERQPPVTTGHHRSPRRSARERGAEAAEQERSGAWRVAAKLGEEGLPPCREWMARAAS